MKQYCFRCMQELKDGSYCTHCMQENKADNISYHLLPGTVINNKYLIGNYIGEGGFGITYIGRDLVLDIKVAVKELFPRGFVNRSSENKNMVEAIGEEQKYIFRRSKERFLSEARALARFTGEKGVVDVRDYFETNGTAYIIMEYLEGENLASYIKKRGVFDAKTIFSLMLPIIYSLDRIHHADMIHRDISPDNIMYLKDGSLKLMDFGNARLFTDSQKDVSVLIKRGYAPIEQYGQGGSLGPWTDVYGICATIYKCITGITPTESPGLQGGTTLPMPTGMGIPVPVELENILRYGMAVNISDRCPNMSTLAYMITNALNRAGDNSTARSTPDPAYKQKQYSDGYYTGETLSSEYGSEAVGMQYKNEANYHKNKSFPFVPVIIASSAAVILGMVVLIFAITSGGDKDKTEHRNSSEASTPFVVSEASSVQSSTDLQEELSALASRNLEDKIARVKEELKEYRTKNRYRSEELEQVKSTISYYEGQINEAVSVQEAEGLKNECIKKLSEIKTDEQLTSEEEAEKKQELKEAQNSSITNIKDSVWLDDYRSAQKAQINTIIQKYEAKIKSAKTAEEINLLEIQGKDEISKVKTDSEMSDEEYEAELRRAEESDNIEDAEAFTSASASSTLPNESSYNYSAKNVLYNDTTCWCENNSDYGIGEWIKLELPKKQRLYGLDIINGYAGTEKQYDNNSKPKDIEIEFSDGSTYSARLKIYSSDDRDTIQTISFPDPVDTSYVKITILSVDAGSCKDTCLTYVGIA